MRRWRDAGRRILFVPEAEVVHAGGRSGGDRLFGQLHASLVRYVRKHHGRLAARVSAARPGRSARPCATRRPLLTPGETRTGEAAFATARPCAGAPERAMKPLLYSVLPRPPHPTRDGLAIRNYHLLAALASRFRVRAFTLRDPERAYGGGEFPAGRRRRVSAAGAAAHATRRRRDLEPRSRRPRYSERLYRSARLARARRHARAPGAAALDRGALVPRGARRARARAGRVWIDFHNLDSEIWERTARPPPRPRGLVRPPPGAARPAPRAPSGRRRRRPLLRVARATRRRSARSARRVEPLVVPNGVDLERYAFRADGAGRRRVFFVGDLSWPPNAEAVRWFAREIWPRDSPRRAPRRASRSWGAARRRTSRGWRRRGSRSLGEVADTRPHWAKAAVAVVPLRAGGGTRLKILEAAACGVPVVSTPIGAEGLEFVPETRDPPRARTPAHFAAAVAELLADPAAAPRRRRSPRGARVEALYGWERDRRRVRARARERRVATRDGSGRAGSRARSRPALFAWSYRDLSAARSAGARRGPPHRRHARRGAGSPSRCSSRRPTKRPSSARGSPNLLAQTHGRLSRSRSAATAAADGTARAARARRARRDRGARSSSSRPGAARPPSSTTWCASSTAELLVFTDANTRFEPGAVAAAGARLRRPGVGAACGRLVFETRAGARETPETRLLGSRDAPQAGRGRGWASASAPTARSTPSGASWSDPLPPDTTSMDDFLIPVRVARAGRSVVFAGEAVAREDAARDVTARGRRGGFGSGSARGRCCARERWLVDAAAHPPAHAGVPLAQGGPLAGAARRAAGRRAALAAPLDAAAGRGRAGARGRPRRWPASAPEPARSGAGRLYYFAVLNVALAAGVAAGLCSATAVRSGRGPPAPEWRASARLGRFATVAASWATWRSRSRRSYAAFYLRTHVAIPGTDTLLPDGSVRFTPGNVAIVAAVQSLSPVVLRALPRPGALPGAAGAPAPAGPPGRAPDARLDLLPGASRTPFPRSVLVLYIVFNGLLLAAWRAALDRAFPRPAAAGADRRHGTRGDPDRRHDPPPSLDGRRARRRARRSRRRTHAGLRFWEPPRTWSTSSRRGRSTRSS